MAPAITIAFCLTAALAARAQGTLADYQRAQDLQAKARGLVVNTPGPVAWIGHTGHFWYPRAVKGGTEFILVDAAKQTKQPAFDHEKLAAAISTATGRHYTALTLPFAPQAGRGGGGRAAAGAPLSTAPLAFSDDERSIEFGAGGVMYHCSLADYTCERGGPIPAFAGRGRGAAPEEEPAPYVSEENGGDPVDGLEYQPFPQQTGGGAAFGRGPSGCAPRAPAESAAQSAGRGGRGGRGAVAAAAVETCRSFDGKWDALIENYNVFLRPVGSNEPATPLSYDGTEGNYYTLRSVAWSPDSKKLVAYHTRPGYDRQVHYIQSSPADQVQPKHFTTGTLPFSAMGAMYRKPGDTVDVAYPALFDIATRQQIEIDRSLFPNPYNITEPVWWKDGRGFTFEYNQRGHQVYRVIEVDAQTGKARALIDEQSKTFIYYNQLGPGLSAGRRYRHDIADGHEILWASERDGWEHLYLYDGLTGKVKNQITRGDWLVRNVDYVDDDKRQIWFEAGGMIPGQDPYFTQYCRINF
ncbi:MAG TPA: DPP IV N-terminal domain-containing protein, partial [Bryobacteraceae bacterium]|nr:DPP IV N-terminal domain-containing protein [Bryobacteraceae bacterium]